MPTLTLPPAGRYRIVSIGPDGRQDRGIGRRYLTFTGDTAEVRDRQSGAPFRTLEVLSVEKTSHKTWELVGDGEIWRVVAGCGCGG